MWSSDVYSTLLGSWLESVQVRPAYIRTAPAQEWLEPVVFSHHETSKKLVEQIIYITNQSGTLALPHVPSASSALTVQLENLLNPLRTKRHLQLAGASACLSICCFIAQSWWLDGNRNSREGRSWFHFSFYGCSVGIEQWSLLRVELSVQVKFCEFC